MAITASVRLCFIYTDNLYVTNYYCAIYINVSRNHHQNNELEILKNRDYFNETENVVNVSVNVVPVTVQL